MNFKLIFVIYHPILYILLQLYIKQFLSLTFFFIKLLLLKMSWKMTKKHVNYIQILVDRPTFLYTCRWTYYVNTSGVWRPLSILNKSYPIFIKLTRNAYWHSTCILDKFNIQPDWPRHMDKFWPFDNKYFFIMFVRTLTWNKIVSNLYQTYIQCIWE